MEVRICDICGEIIHRQKYKLTVETEYYEPPKYKDSYHKQKQLPSLSPDSYQKIAEREICLECKKILDYIFTLRKEKLKKLREESQEFFKENNNRVSS